VNVTFHTLAALATAAVLSHRDESKSIGRESGRSAPSYRATSLVTGFAAGLLLHGLLDYLPHWYPIASRADVILSIALVTAAITFAKQRHRFLIAVCFSGAIFPDLVDLGPAILNMQFGWSLPVIKVFPWHWPQFSGSVYDRRRALQSLALHLTVVGLSVGFLYRFRRKMFAIT